MEHISFEESCTGCGFCARICPMGTILFKKDDESEKKGHPYISFPDTCLLCGHCVSVCPVDAVVHHKLPMDEFPLIEKKDKGQVIDYNDFVRLTRTRRSIRWFEDKPVSDELIEKILQESVRYAPTSKNTQKVSVIVVKGDRLQALADELKRAVIKFYKMSKLLRRISKKMKSQWHMVSNAMEAYQQGLDICMRGAPVALFFVTDDLDTKDWYASGTILAYHTVLTAEISGLKTCLLGMILNALPFAKKVPEIIELPKDNKIIMAVLMGYSRVKYRRLTPRNPLDIKYLT